MCHRNYIFSGIIENKRRALQSRRIRPFEFILEPGIVYKMQVDAPRKSILGDVAAQWRQNVRLLIGRFHSAGRWPIKWEEMVWLPRRFCWRGVWGRWLSGLEVAGEVLAELPAADFRRFGFFRRQPPPVVVRLVAVYLGHLLLPINCTTICQGPTSPTGGLRPTVGEY